MQFIIDTDNREINVISSFSKEEFTETMDKLPKEWQTWPLQIIHGKNPNQLEIPFKNTIPTVNSECTCDPQDLQPHGECQCKSREASN